MQSREHRFAHPSVPLRADRAERAPQDRIELSALKTQFNELMLKPVTEGGYGKTEDDLWTRYHVKIGADLLWQSGSTKRDAGAFPLG